MKRDSRTIITTKFFINGSSYHATDLPYVASIPDKFFTTADGLVELTSWLDENTEDIFFTCFHKKTVRFRSESDATYMKLVLG